MPRKLPYLNSPMDMVRDRFLAVMSIIQMHYKEVRTIKPFAKAIGAPYISLYRIVKYEAEPSLENVTMMCLKFRASPEFIILGKGQMFGNAETEARLSNLEKRI